MIRLVSILAVSSVLSVCLIVSTALAQAVTLSRADVAWIGERIFQNECGRREECLLHWNAGEDFMSLGIGHFIWYPKGPKGPYEESFPLLVEYLKTDGAPIPGWLAVSPVPPCPWSTREEFLNQRGSPKAKELQSLLADTKYLQAEFVIHRFNGSLRAIIAGLPADSRRSVDANFQWLMNSRDGVFALLDYSHFKGTGLAETERYRGQGWGLIDVLSGMSPSRNEREALAEFVRSAKKVLEQRVRSAPPERDEQRWLAGWHNRVDNYIKN